MEANPLDVTPEFVTAVRECGITRVSLGAQSLDATVLAALDRDHRPDDVLRAADQLLTSGLTVSLDLMTAAPGQSLAEVEADLSAAVGLAVEHISVYCLTWEKGTAFEVHRQKGQLQQVDNAIEQAMLGLSGFTSTVRDLGDTTRSMSSIGIAPNRTSFPMTIAPPKPTRFLKWISNGPT